MKFSNNLILGLDVGTTTCKIAIFDLASKKYSIVLKEYNLSTPKPGWIEINPEVMWNSILSGIKECIHNSNCNPKSIKALSYSVLGCAVTALDKNGNVLYPFIEGWDSRDSGYKKYMDFFEEEIGINKIFKITGNYLEYGSINKILWLRDNKNKLFKKTWKLLCAGDYITYKLTGLPLIDPSMASTTIIFDIRKNKYSDKILKIVGLDKNLFAEVLDAGKIAGTITKEISDKTKMNKNTMVIVGGHDQTCSALGIGNIKEGIISDGLGTVECLGITTDKIITSKEMFNHKHPNYPHVVPGKFFSWGIQLTSGMMQKWYKDTLCAKETKIAKERGFNVYDQIEELASKSPVGSNGIFILPHLRGGSTGVKPPLNMFSKCSIIGLNLSHVKNDISRAVLEGVAFESRLIAESFSKIGIKINEIRACGGGTKSDLWLQIRSNILNKKILVPKFKDSGLLGAIILASIGAGFFKNVENAVDCLVEIEKTIYPQDKDIIKTYDKHFHVYKKIYPALLPIYDDIKSL